MTATINRTVAADERWLGLVGMYGGWVAAAFADQAADPGYWLASLGIRFFARVEPDTMRFDAATPHRGRRTMTRHLTLVQGGRARAEATAVLLRRDGAAPRIRTLANARTGPPDEYEQRPHVQGALAFTRNLEIRTPPAAGVDNGTRAWLRLAAPGPALGLRTPQAAACALLDALLPTLFAGDDPPAFVPTVEFGYTFTPAVDEVSGDWFVGENRLDWLDGTLCAEDATLLDAASGRLVARQRQLRSIRYELERTAR